MTTHAEGRLIGDPMLQSVPGFRGRRRTPIREEADVLIVTIADFRSTPRIRAGHRREPDRRVDRAGKSRVMRDTSGGRLGRSGQSRALTSEPLVWALEYPSSPDSGQVCRSIVDTWGVLGSGPASMEALLRCRSVNFCQREELSAHLASVGPVLGS